MNLWESFKELPFWSQLTIGGATLAGAFMVIGEMRNNHLIQQSAESFEAEGICICGSSCNCDCGCAESGVCNCGPSCPCSCGCGVANAESFDAETCDICGDKHSWERGCKMFDCVICGYNNEDENFLIEKTGDIVCPDCMTSEHWTLWDCQNFSYNPQSYDGKAPCPPTLKCGHKAESFEAPLFSPSDDDDEERDFNPHESYNCHVCDRPYEFSKIARSLAQHYLKESDGGEKEWYHSKSNPEGIRKTARNIAGYELYYYGMQALEHYMAKSKPSKLRETVIELLRKATVPNIIVGDVVQFIETLEIEGVDDLDPKYGKEWSEEMAAESKCACGCSIGKCECDEGCKCGCNHKKGGAKWANPTKKN